MSAACVVAALVALLLPTTASAAAAPPQVAWREATKLAIMPIFAPTTLFGLALTTPYVAIQPPTSSPRCQFLEASYAHAGSSLSVTEVANYRECGNLGDLQFVRTVRVGSAVARLYRCASCRSTAPIELTWTAKGTFVDLGWTKVTVNHVIDVARGMTVVHRPPTISPGTARGSDQMTDANYVLSHNTGCAGYPKCPLVFQQTTDGSGHPLIAVDLQAVGADACGAFGVAYFFDGTTYLSSTSSLQPRAGVSAGPRPLFVEAPGEFGVNYPVSSGSGGPCSEYGNLGVDTYLYKWNGSGMAIAAGQRPKAPAVLH